MALGYCDAIPVKMFHYFLSAFQGLIKLDLNCTSGVKDEHLVLIGKHCKHLEYITTYIDYIIFLNF